MLLWNTPERQEMSGFCTTLDTIMVRPLVLAVSTRSILNMCRTTRSITYTSTICEPFRSFHPHYIAETNHETSHEWGLEMLLSGGATGVPKSTGSTSGVYTASCEYSLFTGDTLDTRVLPRIWDFCSACARGRLLRILPVLAVYGPSVLLLFPVLT